MSHDCFAAQAMDDLGVCGSAAQRLGAPRSLSTPSLAQQHGRIPGSLSHPPNPGVLMTAIPTPQSLPPPNLCPFELFHGSSRAEVEAWGIQQSQIADTAPKFSPNAAAVATTEKCCLRLHTAACNATTCPCHSVFHQICYAPLAFSIFLLLLPGRPTAYVRQLMATPDHFASFSKLASHSQNPLKGSSPTIAHAIPKSYMILIA